MTTEKKQRICHIAALTENYVIGRDNDLPWHLPADMRDFKRKTLGKPIIMGRKNFLTLKKPLPERPNIVVTRQENLVAPGFFVVHQIEAAIALAKTLTDDEIMIIGGGEIYRQTMDLVDRLYLTRIHTELAGDVFYPQPKWQEWQLVDEQQYQHDEQHAFDFTFQIWDRK